MSVRKNEIRIGNVIRSDSTTITINSGNISDVINHSERYMPLPVTKEVLIKSGFIKRPNSNFYLLNKLEDYYFIFTGRIGILYKVDSGVVGVPIRFIHELQNSLFYLTGKEIKVACE